MLKKLTLSHFKHPNDNSSKIKFSKPANHFDWDDLNLSKIGFGVSGNREGDKFKLKTSTINEADMFCSRSTFCLFFYV